MTTLQKAPSRGEPAIVTLERELRGAEAKFRDMLPRDANATNWIALTVSYFRQNPGLLQCDPGTRRTAILKGARTGLTFDGKQAYILSFFNGRKKCSEAVFGVGYKGLLHLAAKYAGILDAVAEPVYERDAFDLEYSSAGDRLSHKPNLGSTSARGKVIGYYAKCTLPNGKPKFVWMSADQVELIKARALARTKGQGPWTTDEVEMGKKTLIIRLFKQIDVDPRLTLAVDYEQQADSGERPEEVVDADFEPVEASQADSLADQMQGDSPPSTTAGAPVEEHVESSPPATTPASEIEADVLPPKTLVFCGRLPGKGGKAGAVKKKPVAEMDADELQEARANAEFELHDSANPAARAYAKGVINLLEAEADKRSRE